MPIDVLILLSQALQDPSSGAARSTHLTAVMLARARTPEGAAKFRVSFVGTSATESGDGGMVSVLQRLELTPVEEQHPFGRVLRFCDHGIDCRMLDTGGHPRRLDEGQQRALDRLLFVFCTTQRPGVVLTYGAYPPESFRRLHLHSLGATVLFAVHNWGYLGAPRGFFGPAHGIDAVLAASDFLLRRYRERFPLPELSTVLPTQMTAETVLAPVRDDPGAVVFVNPMLEKGVSVFVRIADEMAQRRPDIPLVVVEARGTRRDLWTAARVAGIDLGRHPRLRVLPCQPLPRDIFARARILLVPSIWAEPAGRLVAEALLNGVPPIVSDRGGLPDECRGAGVVIPLPAHIQPSTNLPPSSADIEPWIAAILHLWDSPEVYAAASAAARRAAQICHPAVVQVECEKLFERLACLSHLCRTTVVRRESAGRDTKVSEGNAG